MSQIGQYSTGGGAGTLSTLTGNTGGAVSPTAGNINVVGTGSISVTGNPGTSTLTISASASGVTSITGNTGSAQTGALTLSGGTTGLAFDSTTTTITMSASQLNLPTPTNAGVGAITNNNVITFTTFGVNTFVGPTSNDLTTLTGSDNVALSAEGCAQNLTSGTFNIAIGSSALSSETTGSNNIAIGDSALSSCIGADSNIALGAALVALDNGASNICIGNNAGTSYVGSESYNIILGESNGTASESQVMRLGNDIGTANPTLATYISGIDGVDVGSVATVVTEASDQLGTAVLTAGSNITITPGANTITIAASVPASFSWSVITGDQSAVAGNGYFCNKAGTLALALPATSAVGDTIEVSNINTATGVQFTQASGQQIYIGNTSTTLGATGTLTSTAVGDSLRIVCSATDTIWRVVSGWGNWTPA